MPGPFKRLHAHYYASVDDKRRLKIPREVLPEIEANLPWVITSLDGKTIRMYPVAEWEKAKSDLRANGQDGEKIISFAESHMSNYGLDTAGRMLLPPSLPCSDRLRGSGVRLVWEKDHVRVISEEQYRALCDR